MSEVQKMQERGHPLLRMVAEDISYDLERINSREARVAEARRFSLLSNVFMSVALKDIAACQHVIRVLVGIDDLIVKEVRTQYTISKINSHDAILDVLAEDRSGKLYSLEIQRRDTVDHARRTRFYNSMIDSEYLEKGKPYYEMPEVHIIYISETDLWKAGKTTYQVEKYFKGTDIPYDDGIHVLYVNAAIDDGSDIAKLMKYFKTADPEDMSQGELSKWVRFLKCEEGGFEVMCDVSEKIYQDGIQEGIQEGEMEKAKKTALNMAQKGFTADMIAEFVEVSADLVTQWIGKKTIAKSR